MTNRHRFEVVADILNAAIRPVRRMHIQYHANMSSAMAKRYIRLLVEAGLLVRASPEYKITDKGIQWLKDFGKVAEPFKNLPFSLGVKTDDKSVRDIGA